MLSFFLTWIVAVVSLVIITNIVPGIVVVSFPAAMLAAVVIGLVDAVVRPIITLLAAVVIHLVAAVVRPIITLLRLPLIIITWNLFLLVVNVVSLLVASWLAGAFSIGFSVNGFWPALFGAIVLSFVSGSVQLCCRLFLG